MDKSDEVVMKLENFRRSTERGVEFHRISSCDVKAREKYFSCSILRSLCASRFSICASLSTIQAR